MVSANWVDAKRAPCYRCMKYSMVGLAIFAGLRRSDLMIFSEENIDLKGFIVFGERKIPIARHWIMTFRWTMYNYPEEYGFPYLHLHGVPMTINKIGWVWKHIQASAGVPHRALHAGRRTFARIKAQDGHSVKEIAKMMGIIPQNVEKLLIPIKYPK